MSDTPAIKVFFEGSTTSLVLDQQSFFTEISQRYQKWAADKIPAPFTDLKTDKNETLESRLAKDPQWIQDLEPREEFSEDRKLDEFSKLPRFRVVIVHGRRNYETVYDLLPRTDGYVSYSFEGNYGFSGINFQSSADLVFHAISWRAFN